MVMLCWLLAKTAVRHACQLHAFVILTCSVIWAKNVHAFRVESFPGVAKRLQGRRIWITERDTLGHPSRSQSRSFYVRSSPDGLVMHSSIAVCQTQDVCSRTGLYIGYRLRVMLTAAIHAKLLRLNYSAIARTTTGAYQDLAARNVVEGDSF